MDVPPLPEGLYQFKWPVDEAGYEFGPLPPIRHREARARGENPNRTYLFRKGGTLVDKFPLREAPALFLDFAAMATGQVPESKVVAFANRHGFLAHWPSDSFPQFDYESMVVWGRALTEIGNFVAVVRAHRETGEPDIHYLAALLNTHLRPKTRLHLNSKARPGERHIHYPLDLVSAMSLQALHWLEEDIGYRQCDLCGKWFSHGPGTGRTKRKRYCSDACRAAAHYKKRRGA